MIEYEFKAWPKIGRDNPFTVTITEKINGTNACVVIKNGVVIGAQSRKRKITPDKDNFGFAAWVNDNRDELEKLGDGYHYGEWAGPGIQKNPLRLEKKEFFLFNTFRRNDDNPNRPECCKVVPVLYIGQLYPDTVPDLLTKLSLKDTQREGVVVYYHALRTYTKHTIFSPNGKWRRG